MKHTIIPALVLLISLSLIGCEEEESEVLAPIMEKYVEFWNTGNFEGIEDILDPNFEFRMTPDFEPLTGIDAFKEEITYYRTAYPDFLLEIEEAFYEDDMAAGRWKVTATNTGPGKYPPTGKKVEVPGMSIFHFKDGKILDEWVAGNNYLWFTQLGYQLVPPAQQQKLKHQ